MGKPLSQARSEVDGMLARARAFVDVAPSALAELVVEDGLNSRPGGLISGSGGFTSRRMLPYADAAQSTDKTRFQRALTREPVGVVALVSPWYERTHGVHGACPLDDVAQKFFVCMGFFLGTTL
jgi:acyl-CoA reductase-like NAD-dependent aldehyde dehydrogenase